MSSYDAVIVGSGPNGLSAAIRLAQEGLSVLVIEGKESIGGGTRSAELTLPGYAHDIRSAIHPLGLASPFLRSLPLEQYGLEWVHPDVPLAHPLDDGSAVILERSLEGTAANLEGDARAYHRLIAPLVADWPGLMEDFLGPFPLPPRHPLTMARFGWRALPSSRMLARAFFKTSRARALFAGNAAHSMLPLEKPATSAFGLMLITLAHVVGWPMAKGGSQNIARALGAHLASLGGEIQTGWMVESLEELPRAKAVLLDLTPLQILDIAGQRLPSRYRRQLERYRYGPGVCKVDWALKEPIPWMAKEAKRAGTVHLGGTFEEIAASERTAWAGKHAGQPFVLLAQQSQFDPCRAPEGKHTAWAYCHVPHGSTEDVSARMEAQIERFAPGFHDTILARSVRSAAQLQAYNPNYVGGDINGGVQDLGQLFTRPVPRWNPYSTPMQGVYLCSSATPPGGGVHGMCGFHAAESVLKDLA